jgi:signal transduction histidine kinase
VLEAITQLGEVALTVWPLGLTLAVVAAGDRVREARRRSALNRALHELRRPLQSLVLVSGTDPGPGSHAIRVTLAALDDLDREINGDRPCPTRRPVAARALVEPAVERWRGAAAASRRSLTLNWRAGFAMVMADPARVAQALDNLIDNAVRHGGLRVSIVAAICPRGLRISVSDSGTWSGELRRPRESRHGHGLKVVATVAREHGGRFGMQQSPAGTTAVLELPLAPAAIPAAEAALAA